MSFETLKRFSKAVATLQDCSVPGDLRQVLPAAMQVLIPANSHIVNWIGPTAFEDMSVSSVPLPREASLEVFNAHVAQHPLLWAIEDAWKVDRPLAGRWSDHTSLRSFRQTAIYHDFFRHTATRHQLGATLRISPQAVLGLSINRDLCDFTAEEVEIAELFMTHAGRLVQSMFARAKMDDLLALQKIALEGAALLILDDECQPLFITERAQQLIRDYFGWTGLDGLPRELFQWLQALPSSGKTFTRQNSLGTLRCVCEAIAPWTESYLRDLVPGAHRPSWVRCLRLSEHREAENIRSLMKLGLTHREAEVLYWITEGKTNGEISVILKLSIRTVGKHCENLFPKLGVESRTAAAGLASQKI